MTARPCPLPFLQPAAATLSSRPGTFHPHFQGKKMSTANKSVDVQMLKDFAAAWNSHDLEALISFMTEDAEFHAVGGPDLLGRTFKGTAALREGFQLAWQTFPDAAWLDGEHFVCGDRGVSES